MTGLNDKRLRPPYFRNGQAACSHHYRLTCDHRRQQGTDGNRRRCAAPIYIFIAAIKLNGIDPY
jgi:hypothetical protein